MRLLRSILVGLALMLDPVLSLNAAEKLPKHCDTAKARPANPYGSILIPVSAAPSPVSTDDDISGAQPRTSKPRKTSANQGATVHFKSC